jgi:hypothetical protein
MVKFTGRPVSRRPLRRRIQPPDLWALAFVVPPAVAAVVLAARWWSA